MLEKLREVALKEIKEITTIEALEAWRVFYLGRKGELTKVLRSLSEKSLEEKKSLGPQAHILKKELEEAFIKKQKFLNIDYQTTGAEIDLTIPGKKPHVGHLHPLTLVENDIRRIFEGMNFSVIEGPELETEYYNFDVLNIPKNHPARDMWDTFWVNREKGLLMKTHTSPMQARYMERHVPPFQIIVPGRCFRYEATDASHETNFYQFEGLMVGEGISLANFKYIISEFFKKFFERPVEIRFRPSYFPFTEPSVEVDVRMEGGKWLEMMGAGMVHPKVFEAVKYDPKRIQGFAFGGGLERFAMIKYKIPDIRLFYSGDLRFIQQF